MERNTELCKEMDGIKAQILKEKNKMRQVKENIDGDGDGGGCGGGGGGGGDGGGDGDGGRGGGGGENELGIEERMRIFEKMMSIAERRDEEEKEDTEQDVIDLEDCIKEIKARQDIEENASCTESADDGGKPLVFNQSPVVEINHLILHLNFKFLSE